MSFGEQEQGLYQLLMMVDTSSVWAEFEPMMFFYTSIDEV